jgi:hypothetical protein
VLGVSDLLADGPLDLDSLARAVGAGTESFADCSVLETGLPTAEAVIRRRRSRHGRWPDAGTRLAPLGSTCVAWVPPLLLSRPP